MSTTQDIELWMKQASEVTKQENEKESRETKAEEVLKKVKEYLEENKKDASLDIQSDSKHLLFWIENWEAE
tara:strand:- start:103 stop:315 length:213 start_codon:yes stop_codon:yes gene_type:complete